MAKYISIPVDTLRKLLKYDPATGKLFWKERTIEFHPRSLKMVNAKFAGKEALCTINKKGYFGGEIFAVRYQAHRVIWAMHYGEWPTDQVDHINGNPIDNRIENLRVVSSRENSRNQKVRSTNHSGVMGVTWQSNRKCWYVRISIDGEHDHYVGRFRNLDEAIAARKAAELKHGYHENHGNR